MPIGVPRIIYCWGEELPAQWTDIYNFVFRRRTIFLMQYLDDELCNQICGLLINIHMEDRSKELEQKEMEKSGLFKSSSSSSKVSTKDSKGSDLEKKTSGGVSKSKTEKSVQDLLISEQDLAIDENDTLEQYTLQKISMDWLNWNAQFFDYGLSASEKPSFSPQRGEKGKRKEAGTRASNNIDANKEEPYLFYLAEILSKDFNKQNPRLLYNTEKKEIAKLMKMFKYMPHLSSFIYKSPNVSKSSTLSTTPEGAESKNTVSLINQPEAIKTIVSNGRKEKSSLVNQKFTNNYMAPLDVYSPFRLIANFAYDTFSFNQLLPNSKALNFSKLSGSGNLHPNKITQTPINIKAGNTVSKAGSPTLDSVKTQLGIQNFSAKYQNHQKQMEVSEKSLSERRLKTEYRHASPKNNIGRRASLSTNVNNFNKQSLTAKPYTAKPENKNKTDKLRTSAPPSVNGGGKRSSYLDFNSFTNQNYKASESYGSSYRKQFEQMLQEEESKKVFVLINSFGGSVGNGITVHDALQFIRAGSFTLALGVAASAASLVLAGGTIGERYVTEGCHVMIHQPEGGLNGQASDIWIDSQEIMKIRLDVAEIYSLSTYRPRHKILRDLDRDFYLNAMETVSYGLADEIATNGVMNDLIDLMNKEWWHNYDSKQQRLLERRESASAAMDTQTQN